MRGRSATCACYYAATRCLVFSDSERLSENLPPLKLTRSLIQVSVFVNGKPIPFNMKIGEAGEAFFVFETDEDVPEELMTSPLLEPVRPGQSSNPADGADRPVGRFGTKKAQAKEERSLLNDVLASNEEGVKIGAASVSRTLNSFVEMLDQHVFLRRTKNQSFWTCPSHQCRDLVDTHPLHLFHLPCPRAPSRLRHFLLPHLQTSMGPCPSLSYPRPSMRPKLLLTSRQKR
jgi:hypothetical protein